MKLIRYQAKITKDGDGYMVSFPDLPGCFSCADSFEEALFNAKEAMDLYLEEAMNPDWALPEPKERKGRNYHWIIPSPEISIPLTIRELREKSEVSQMEVARRLNMKVQQYQKLEYPRKSNPTTKSLMAVADSLGYEVEFVKKKGA
ncbi:MAG TPA: type II toxin-antitoxin system HicB family antitoxin [Bacteriovoracaceae bacterium]|nr:type II toxin-antitoxin system HicB family antitoxin [Bacteriovoracaceae bacterium]